MMSWPVSSLVKQRKVGIFFRETLQAFGHFVAVLLGLRLDGHDDDRLGERRRFERDVKVFVAERVASGDVAQPDERGDVAGVTLRRCPCVRCLGSP